ncbi:hypothetical protein ORI20_10585 [Mycobacterium sp. CVI_P3]|uniref:PE-PPE domain-containing protein n=1 Tax=Mycobacterium pinniadriaticum TaxID=2994102 RepID=A0ABT3SE12_9MYCO|nr:hypothetical protein [Mycobacterium pinniadriaticum]MCX2930726.1 hypothetical protein [Mycobacterium pinniadriaticum]MCX2937150.1 hypothetical protein [Mycobacterium pinniadriaticum]
MPDAASSLYKTSIALAGAGVIAVSPLAASQDGRIAAVHLPHIQLTDVTTPAFGAIPYQIGINVLGDIIAAAPILIGSTQQCETYCLGPNTPAPAPTYAPFTGWGLVGLGKGLISSPFALVTALQAGQDVAQALGVALLAIQVPITNTFSLLLAPRVPAGGFALQETLDRAFAAYKHAVDYAINIAAQALVTGPLTILGGAVEGATAFTATLAQTGDFATAFANGRAPIHASVTTAVTDLVNEVNEGRTTIYADLTAGPGVATSPIPTVPAPTAASARVTKVINSAKAVPGTTASPAAATGDSGSADTAGGGQSAGPRKSGVGGSKRAHKAAAGG